MWQLIGLVLWFIYAVPPFAAEAGIGMTSPLYWIGGVVVYFIAVGFIASGGFPNDRPNGSGPRVGYHNHHDDDY